MPENVVKPSIFIGWYCPTSKRFCYNDEKEARPDSYKAYTQQVYAIVDIEKNPQNGRKRLDSSASSSQD